MFKTKFLILSIIIGCALFSSLETKAYEHEHNHNHNHNHVHKRFLGSVGSWINNNIINPITSGVNNVIDSISDPLANFGNQLQNIAGQVDSFFSNNLVNAVNTALNTIKEQSINLYNMAVDFFFPSGNNGAPLQDPCQSTCFQRINYQNQITDYYFDKPNGCISKGFVDSSVEIFNACCDEHNYCLNAKCCTNDCQLHKNQCDTQYNNCLKQKCEGLVSDSVQFYTCLARASFIGSAAVNRTCSTTITQNRKVCYC